MDGKHLNKLCRLRSDEQARLVPQSLLLILFKFLSQKREMCVIWNAENHYRNVWVGVRTFTLGNICNPGSLLLCPEQVFRIMNETSEKLITGMSSTMKQILIRPSSWLGFVGKKERN